MVNKKNNHLTPTDICVEIHDYVSFLEEGGGPQKTKEELINWLSYLISRQKKYRKFIKK